MTIKWNTSTAIWTPPVLVVFVLQLHAWEVNLPQTQKSVLVEVFIQTAVRQKGYTANALQYVAELLSASFCKGFSWAVPSCFFSVALFMSIGTLSSWSSISSFWDMKTAQLWGGVISSSRFRDIWNGSSLCPPHVGYAGIQILGLFLLLKSSLEGACICHHY